jgi:hypothetical protein
VPTVSQIYYEVVADYNRQPREESKELKVIANAYEDAALRANAELVAGAANRIPTHLDVMSLLAQNPPSPHFHDAMSAVYAESGEDWLDVHEKLGANQELWEFEDQNVPKALLIRYSWMENGVLKGPYSETVSIVLPNSLAAKFKM